MVNVLRRFSKPIMVVVTLFVVISFVVYAPSIIRGERIAPGQPVTENQWLGGPRKSAGELAAADTEDSKAGGASGQDRRHGPSAGRDGGGKRTDCPSDP